LDQQAKVTSIMDITKKNTGLPQFDGNVIRSSLRNLTINDIDNKLHIIIIFIHTIIKIIYYIICNVLINYVILYSYNNVNLCI
jgi:hypothetical protein